jgi:hypothetical protein
MIDLGKIPGRKGKRRAHLPRQRNRVGSLNLISIFDLHRERIFSKGCIVHWWGFTFPAIEHLWASRHELKIEFSYYKRQLSLL